MCLASRLASQSTRALLARHTNAHTHACPGPCCCSARLTRKLTHACGAPNLLHATCVISAGQTKAAKGRSAGHGEQTALDTRRHRSIVKGLCKGRHSNIKKDLGVDIGTMKHMLNASAATLDMQSVACGAATASRSRQFGFPHAPPCGERMHAGNA
jgi:hypothetical protein